LFELVKQIYAITNEEPRQLGAEQKQLSYAWLQTLEDITFENPKKSKNRN
jgi:hypothetical protein